MSDWLNRNRQIIMGFAIGLTVLLVVIILIGVLAPTPEENNSPSADPTTTPRATSTRPPEGATTTPSPPLGISRESIQTQFEDASYQFTTHGSNDWVSGTFFDGTGSGITLDLFGPAHAIEAVELTFSLTSILNDGVHETAIALSGELLLLTIAPGWTDGPGWFTETVATFGTNGNEDIRTVQQGKLFRLVFVSDRKLGVFLIEGH